MQFIFRYEIGDAYLGAVSRFMTNAFEYGDTLVPPSEKSSSLEGGDEIDKQSAPKVEPNMPYLNLATSAFACLPCACLTHIVNRFRMVVLADEVLESFFETDLSASFSLQPIADMELPLSNGGFLGDLWSNIATDTNKKMFNKLTDELGKTIGKHQVIKMLRQLHLS